MRGIYHLSPTVCLSAMSTAAATVATAAATVATAATAAATDMTATTDVGIDTTTTTDVGIDTTTTAAAATTSAVAMGINIANDPRPALFSSVSVNGLLTDLPRCI